MNKIKTDIQWGYYGEKIGADSKTNGLENTNKVLARDDIPENSIWEFCKKVREETGDNSWYIPAIKELEAKYPNGFDIEGLGCTLLWSSTEYNSYYACNRDYNGNTYASYRFSYFKTSTSGSVWYYAAELFHKEIE